MPKDFFTFGRNADFLKVIIRHEVDFMIVGGMAVAFHGCRDNSNVDDLDLLLDATPINSTKLSLALTELGLRAPKESNFLKPNLQMAIKSDFYLDILTEPPEFDYARARKRCANGLINGCDVQFVGKDDLILFKEITVRRIDEDIANLHTDRGKHLRDLICLKKIK